ncbi:MAG: HEAT repeat domain-containing protein [Phycisphaerae bacterium]
MKSPIRTTLVLAGAVVLALASAARAQPYTLRYRCQPGEQRIYQRSQRNERVIRQGENSRRTVAEQTGTHEELVLREGAQPGAFLIAVLETPQPERIVTLKINGQDRLADLPEEARTRPMPPNIILEERGPRGEPPAPVPPADDLAVGLSALQGAMSHLPDQPVSPGEKWTRDLDLGTVRGTLRTKFVEVKDVGGTACAVLDVSLAATIAGNLAERLQIEKMDARLCVALDGSGLVEVSATHIVREKANNAEQRTVQTFEVRLAKTNQLGADALARAAADAEPLLQAMNQIRADDHVAALETLRGFLSDRADSPWAPAVQNLFAGVLQDRLMTKPLPPAELRVVLRDLRRAHDEAQQRGAGPELAAGRNLARRVAGTNLQVVLDESKNSDPFVRELAAFALAFAEDPSARRRLVELAQDASPSVRAASGIGLAIQEKPVGRDLLLAMLKDENELVRGAAALVALRTVPRGDATATAALPLLLANLGIGQPWARAQTVGAIGILAPVASTETIAALLDASKKETAEDIKPLYLQALRSLTGVEGEDLSLFEAWLAKQQAAPPLAPPPEKTSEPKPESPKPKG